MHYGKGSVLMYHLQEMIGEDSVNAALRSLLEKFAYKSESHYPTTLDLIAELRKRTPDKYSTLIDDLFHKIFLFNNRAVESSYKRSPDGQFQVTFKAKCKKLVANGKGMDTEIALNDWIDVAAFADQKQDGDMARCCTTSAFALRGLTLK